MKYQGFYDYAIDASGNPDRAFTAQQFCRHLSAIFGNGIVITNATGNDAWKVEKITNEDLKIKIKLGSNSFNFASLRGNPFAVDEEINIELSQGTDRWDAIMIRADATSTVRATDIKVTENNIALTRTDTIYDLRLARVHIVNNVVTEIIDDRLNNDYCGIAAGLATINADDILNSIKNELESIESGELVALKNGLLQTNLNAEKLEGKRKEEILFLSNRYITPSLSNETPQAYQSPSLTSSNPQGYELTTENIPSTEGGVANGIVRNINDLYTFIGGDGASNIAGQRTSGTGTHATIFLKCPVYIKLSQVDVTFSGQLNVYGSNDNSNWKELAITSKVEYATTQNISINNGDYYKYFKFYWHKTTSSLAQYLKNDILLKGKSISSVEQNKMVIGNSQDVSEINYEKGIVVKIYTPKNYIESSEINSSINMYGIGAKKVPNNLQADKMYSLVYDGEKFIQENEEIINAIVALGGSL